MSLIPENVKHFQVSYSFTHLQFFATSISTCQYISLTCFQLLIYQLTIFTMVKSLLFSQFFTFSDNVEKFITFPLLQSSIKTLTTQLLLPHFLYLYIELTTLDDNMVELSLLLIMQSPVLKFCSESSLEAGFRFPASTFKLVHNSFTYFFSQTCLFSNLPLYTNC